MTDLNPPNRSGCIAFVPARFGGEVGGGAEIVLAQLAKGLSHRGWPVEILTTTAVDHYTWEDTYPPGVSEDPPQEAATSAVKSVAGRATEINRRPDTG